MRNDDLGVGSDPGLDPPGFPIPENDISIRIPARYPLSIWTESDLASVPSDGVAREAFFAILPEVLGGVDDDLIVQRLGGEPFLWRNDSIRYE